MWRARGSLAHSPLSHLSRRTIARELPLLLLLFARFASLLARAMASVPLASDPGGPLDVVYEDHQLLAVNKPVGLHTAPIHRFTGACGACGV